MAKKYSETQLISEDLLKLWSPISKNVGIDRVFPYVSLGQEFYLTPVLGQPLKEELQHQIEDDNLTEANKALIIKIAPALAFWTSYLALRGLAYSFTQKGISLEKSENSQPISEKELGEYELNLKNQAEMFTEILIKYLCHCKDLYPLWRPEHPCLCDKYNEGEGSNEKTYHNLIYFPNKKGNDCGCGCNNDYWIAKK